MPGSATPPGLCSPFVSRVGLVLGGGGITGAAYEMAALIGVELATGWDAASADVVVGTSAGAFVGAVVRSGNLSVESMVRHQDSAQDVANRIRAHMFQRASLGGVTRWLRHGLVPGLTKPGVRLILGTPGRFTPEGIAEWLDYQIGDHAHDWPELPTLITSYELESQSRVVFGTIGAPEVSIRDAVAASSAVPMVFDPHRIEDRHYIDGGVLSGTHADLVLGSDNPLDLVLIIAPLASDVPREGAPFYENMFDRVGRIALEEEIRLIRETWPDTDIITLKPNPDVLQSMRPNPLAPEAAVPTFIATLSSMRTKLAAAATWAKLKTHLTGRRRVRR